MDEKISIPKEVKMVKITDLKAAEYNPRKISPTQMQKLKSSIQQFGFLQPVVVNKDNTVIGGHMRIAAAMQLNLKEVPVLYVNFTKEKEMVLNLALNRVQGEWDTEKLVEVIDQIQAWPGELDLTGFETQEINEMLAKFIVGPSKTKEFNEEEVLKEIKKSKPTIKTGDIIKLGNHRIMCGCSDNAEHVSKLFGAARCDLVFTSPPYNVSIDYSTYKDDRDYIEMLRKVFYNCYSIMNKHRYIAVNIGREMNVNTSAHTSVLLEGIGFKFFRNIYWIKPLGSGPVPSMTVKYPFPRYYEPMLRTEKIILYVNELDGQIPEDAEIMIVYQKDLVAGNRPEKDQKIPKELISKYVGNVWYIGAEGRLGGKGADGHPAPFPMQLPLNGCNFFAREGENVYDPFAGSGTTLLACEQTGRRFFGMEMDPTYCMLIEKRYNAYKGMQKA